LHQLIGEKLIYPALDKRRSAHMKSGTTGLAVSLFGIPAALIASALYDQQNALIVLFFCLVFGYIMVYHAISNMGAGRSKAIHLAVNEVFTEKKVPQKKVDGGRG
jgi:hypothetical protein